ncbi:hypothetical protein GBA52_024129 [Prunus armeniaca]|nr:hypothetical protein GBA52_024129 [Prunus armeniaca]
MASTRVLRIMTERRQDSSIDAPVRANIRTGDVASSLLETVMMEYLKDPLFENLMKHSRFIADT